MKTNAGSRAAFFLLPFAFLLLSACQQQMANQPSYRPLQSSSFFRDGRASRPLVPGTVPRGRPLVDSPLLTGLAQRQAAAGPAAEYVGAFPIPVTRAALERGQERFTIFCAVCHDDAGTGRGKIVERGYLQPPNFHTDNSRGLRRRGAIVPLRTVPVGYLFEVVRNGYGGMPDYASQIPAADRWRIIMYVRTLQISRHVPLADLPPGEQKKARAQLEGQP
ncbi:MAG TPA: cytochrome c [Gemmataceae bacterium]|jgi:mono/diheme cytochrome c family protein|nr:cytochrome c [Gemmataceae bacterium]